MPPDDTKPAWIYERKLVPTLFGPWAEDLVTFGEIETGTHVLDAGCGTGTVARLIPPLVGPTGRTVALDFDPEMLEVGAALFPDIDWQEGDLQNMPFDASSFDLVIAQQSLQFLPDRDAGLREIHRVLRREGQLVLSVWTEIRKSPGQAVMFEELGKLIEKDMSRPPPWSLTDESELLALVDRAGFLVTETTVRSRHSNFPSARGFVEALMAGASKLTRQALAQVPDPDKEVFVNTAAARLQDYQTAQGFLVPMETRVLLARKA